MAEHDDQTVDDLDQRIAELERLEPYEALYRRRADVGHGDQAEALMKRAEAAEAKMKQANEDADAAVKWQQFYMDKVDAAEARLHDAAETIRRQATELARMREALDWALPLAELCLEETRTERLRYGHSDIGREAGHPGLWPGEIADRENARQALAAAREAGEEKDDE